jgi:hypothetical protein
MPGSRKWTGEELDALAALMEEADGEVTDWDALAAQLPNDPDYAIRSGRAAQTMSGREELREVIMGHDRARERQSAQWPSWRSMERWSGAPWRGCASREGDKPSSSTRTCSRGTSGAPRIYQGEVQEVERRINIHSFIVILRLLGIFHES